jgi:hypothetical protein
MKIINVSPRQCGRLFSGKIAMFLLALAGSLPISSHAEMSKQEFARMKFWQGVADIKRCEAKMIAEGYNEQKWQECSWEVMPREDVSARFLGQYYEGARYQVELSHLIKGHKVSLRPGTSFLQEFQTTSDHDDTETLCAVFQIDCGDLRAVMAETAAQLHDLIPR